MARGRLVATSIATDKRLNSLSLESEWLFLKSIPHLDRDGLILGDACLLVARVCPRRPEALSMADGLIAEWLAAGLVISYECEDGRVLFFPGFAKNQDLRYDRERASELPPPPGWERTEDGLALIETAAEAPSAGPVTGDNQQNPELVRSNDGALPEEIPYYNYNYKEDLSRTPAHASPPESKSESPKPAHRPPPVVPVPESRPFAQKVVKSPPSPHMPKGLRLPGGYVPAGEGQNPVQVYYERFRFDNPEARLSAPQEDDLVRMCPDLPKLRQVVVAYSQAGHRPRNVKLILDWYTNGCPVAPGAAGKNTPAAAKPKGPKFINIPEAAL